MRLTIETTPPKFVLFFIFVFVSAVMAMNVTAEPGKSTWIEEHMDSDLVPAAEYGVLLPPGYSSKKSYPLLLLLHGGGGSRESTKQLRPVIEAAWKTGDLPPVVALTPNARRSFYMDYKDGSQKWESWIIDELLPHIQKRYQAGQDHSTTVVAGVSMGGLGSLRLAFKHPSVFSAVAAIEPAIEAGANWNQLSEIDKFYRAGSVVTEKFGNPVDETYWRKNHPTSIAIDNPLALEQSRLAIYFEVGDRDSLYLFRGAEYLHRALFDRDISHEFRFVRNADHVGPSVPKRVADGLKFLGKHLRGEQGDPVPQRMHNRFNKLKRTNPEAFSNPRQLPPIPLSSERRPASQ